MVYLAVSHSGFVEQINTAHERKTQAARVKTVIATLKAELSKTENGIDTENPFLVTFRKHENIEKLTKEMLIELVDHVKVYEGGDVAVRFKYKDELCHV